MIDNNGSPFQSHQPGGTEETLRMSQSLLDMASRVSRLGAWVVHFPGRKMTWSNEVRILHEVSEDFVPTMESVTRFFAPEHRTTLHNLYRQCAAQGDSFDIELELITAKNNRLWVRTIGEAVRNSQGEIIRVQGAIQDISRQKQSEVREVAMAHRMVNHLESMSDGLLTIDRDWRVTYVNSQAERTLGLDRKALLGNNLWDSFPEGIGSMFDEQYNHAVNTGQTVSFEEFYAPIGLWLNVRAYPSSEGLAIYFRNESSRRAEKEQLQLLEKTVANLNDSVVITQADLIDPQGSRIIYVNEAFEKITGFSREDAIGQTPAMLHGPLTSLVDIDRIRTTLKNRRPVRAELINYTKQGKVFWIEMETVPMFDSTGRLANFASIGRDVTERKRLTSELHELNSDLERRVLDRTTELEAVNEELEAFAYSVSHDLRSPLNTINGFCALLGKDKGNVLSEKSEHYLRRIHSGTKMMGNLIDGLLALAKSSSNTVCRGPVDLTALSRRIVAELKQTEPERSVEIEIQDGMRVQADPLMLSVVMQNLIGNAWKFSQRSPQACIEVSCASDSEGKIIYAVKDNGVGFDQAKASKLFGIFERLHSVDEFPGTGIGLANVRRVVLRHGGQVWSESEVGKGAAFFFTL